MATVVNNPGTAEASSDGMSFMIGMIMLLLVVFLFFYFGLPALRGSTGDSGGIQVPRQLDVNVNTPTQ